MSRVPGTVVDLVFVDQDYIAHRVEREVDAAYAHVACDDAGVRLVADSWLTQGEVTCLTCLAL